jgi:hypothetical protein
VLFRSGRHETGWLGDKDPRCIEFLPLLASLFSDMRVLHIIRDPRDVLASKKKAAWSRDASVLRHVFANRVQLKMGRRWGEKLFGDAYMELFYEDLICEPEKELTRVCELLGLDFDARMLEFGASGRQLVSESEMQWKKETLGPLLRGNRGKWKGCLSDFETALAERACAETMRVGNYDPSGTWQRLSKLERARCMAIVAGFSLGDPIYRHMRVRRQRL